MWESNVDLARRELECRSTSRQWEIAIRASKLFVILGSGDEIAFNPTGATKIRNGARKEKKSFNLNSICF